MNSRRALTRIIPLVAIFADTWHKLKATPADFLTMFGGKQNAYSAETVTFAVDEATQDYAVGGKL